VPVAVETLAIDALASLGALLVALAGLRLGAWMYAMMAPHDAEAVPLLHTLALVAGLAMGVALLANTPHLAEFALTRVFAADGFWEVDLWHFLRAHALPSGATLARTLEALAGEGGAVRVWTARVALLALVPGGLAALRWWGGTARLWAVLAFLLLALWSAVMLAYATHLLAWASAQLSFWLFLVALILFQRWRYRFRTPAH
jgi:hypothetical protein